MLYAQGEYDEAVSFQKRALAIEEKQLGPDHPSVAISLHNLASLYCKVQREEEARQLWDRAISIAENALGADHPHTQLFREHQQQLPTQ